MLPCISVASYNSSQGRSRNVQMGGGGALSKITIMIAKELAMPYKHIGANDEVKMA